LTEHFSKIGILKRLAKDLWTLIISYTYFLIAIILMNTLDISNPIVKNVTGFIFATGVVFVLISLLYVLKRK
jgi:hypothetical protein